VERPSPRQLIAWFCTWAAAQLLLVTGPIWLRAKSFGFSNYDLGIYSQALARLAIDPPNPWLSGRQIHVFNDHFDPILFVVTPFTRLFPAAQVGIAMEAGCALLALGALAWLAWNGRLGLRALWLLGGLLTFSPGVTQALGFPFHPTTWAMTPMAWLLAAALLERWRVLIVALIILLACKEEFPFVGLALVPYLWFRAPRRITWSVLGLSAAWGLFALVLRPRLLGDVMPYASQPFRGLEEGVGAFFATRFSGKALAGMGELIVAFIPALWLTRSVRAESRTTDPLATPGDARVLDSARTDRWLFATLLPMLGIRFLSVAWRDHYGAVVVSAGVLALAGLLGRKPIPLWALISTLVLLLAGNELLLRRDLRAVTGQHGWGASAGCTDQPGRTQSIRAALERMRSEPGPLFVSGNLLPWLAERDDVYAFGGPQPASLTPRVVLLEKPPCGDTWAQSLDERQATLETYRTAEVLLDDEHVFAARVK
jgi:hypothetical protein